MIDLYKNIKYIRTSQKMSQQTLAEKVGYTGKSMISKVERGEVDLSTTMIKKFADALDVTPSYLMGWDEVEWDRKEQQITVDIDYSAEDNILIEAFHNTDNLHKQMVLEILGLLEDKQ